MGSSTVLSYRFGIFKNTKGARMLLIFLVLAVIQMANAQDGAAYNYTDCGITEHLGKRIVDGQPTDHKEWPWQVYIPSCGGTIVTENCVVTAKHCIEGKEDMENSAFDVYGGVYYRSYIGRDYNIQHRTAAETVMHPDFDIAVIKVNEPFDFSKGAVNSACLPTPGLTYAGELGTATGFGREEKEGETSDVLQEVEIPILADDAPQCAAREGVLENEICTAHLTKGTCHGDSGGPLVLQGGDGKWSLVGVTANGYMGYKPGYNPDIFMRVTYFMDWIQNTCKGSGPILGGTETTTPTPTCEDSSSYGPYCADYKMWGYCGMTSVAENCKKTCGSCN